MWITADSSGVIDGALVTVDIGAPGHGVRLASPTTDFDELTDDRDAAGLNGALAVLRAVDSTVKQMISEARDRLGVFDRVRW